jgi:hypothetical protein
MNNAIKNNQSQSNIELDIISDKLNFILSTLDSAHLKIDYDKKVIENPAHKYDGVTYENLTLSESINNKIKHNNELIDKICDLVIPPKIIKEDIVVEDNIEEKVQEPVKKTVGFQKGHKALYKKVTENVENKS